MNYYLKANNEQELWKALEDAGLAHKKYDMEDEKNIRPIEADETWTMTGAFEWIFTGTALDIIGEIFVETGEILTDEDGKKYPEIEAIEGYHANLVAAVDIEGLPVIDAPSTPYRKWAGQ